MRSLPVVAQPICVEISTTPPSTQHIGRSETDNQQEMKPLPQDKDFVATMTFCSFCGEHGHLRRSSKKCKRHFEVALKTEYRRTKKMSCVRDSNLAERNELTMRNDNIDITSTISERVRGGEHTATEVSLPVVSQNDGSWDFETNIAANTSLRMRADANRNPDMNRNTHEQMESSHTVPTLCHQNFGPVSEEKVNFENPLRDVEIIDALPLQK